jgi:hypothetical protein
VIAGIEESGVLTGPDLDELAESLISDKIMVVFPLVWISERWWSTTPLRVRPGR